jgi:alpha-beta hydrolase superfamily lysophospholipase
MTSRQTASLAWTLLLVGMTGCAHSPNVNVRRAEPPPPKTEPGIARTDEVFERPDHISLYGRALRPEAGEVRGVVVFVNGLKDHGDHYAAVSQEIAAKGFATYAFDTRGHGRSSGERAYVERFDEYVDDLSAFVEHVRAREPGKPIFVFGHSMGGAIVTLWAVERHPDVAGIILSGPALEIDGPAVQSAAVRLFDTLTPRATVFDLPNENFSRDPAVVADMSHDPLVYQDPATAHLAAEILGAMERVWAHPEKLTVPLLALHGTADKLTAPSGSRDLVALAGSRDKTLRLYDGFFHDLVHEPGHERVVADMTHWLDAHAGGDASKAPPSDYDASKEAPKLAGDRIASSTSVEIDGRGERGSSGSTHVLAATGGLRLRQAFGRVGYLGGLDARAGSEAGFRWEADLHAIGVGARMATFQIGLTAALGLRGIDGSVTVHSPAEMSIDGSLGPVRLLSRASLGLRLNHGGPGADVLGIADEANALLGFRLGRDLRYWSDVHAGRGPFIAGTYTRRDNLDFWGVALGLDLWGAN